MRKGYLLIFSMQAVISSDSILRIYECHDLHNLSQWNASITVDVTNLSPPAPIAGLGLGTSLVDSLHSLSAPNVPVSSSAASSNGFSIGSGSTTGDKHGLGKKEADGGWCLSWCKDKTYGELCAVTAGATGSVKVHHSHFLAFHIALTPPADHSTPLFPSCCPCAHFIFYWPNQRGRKACTCDSICILGTFVWSTIPSHRDGRTRWQRADMEVDTSRGQPVPAWSRWGFEMEGNECWHV